MSFVTLVRHGQANTAAQEEGDYDRLSDLGWQQARWLGAHFRAAGDRFARAYCGSLRRHQETAEGIGAVGPAEIILDERLNEMEYFTLSSALSAEHGIAAPSVREDFIAYFPLLLQHWHDDKIEGAPERFSSFQARVTDAVTEIAAGDGRALVVTSGGVIGAVMRSVMRLDIPAMAHMGLAIENSSVHRIQPMPRGDLAVTQFNALPHLDTPERQHARSHL